MRYWIKGWSAVRADVDLTRVVAELLSTVEGESTTLTLEQVVSHLGVTGFDVSAAYRELDDAGLFEQVALRPNMGLLTLSPFGNQVRSEFNAAGDQRGLRKGARSALLRWLHERDTAAGGSVPLDNILGTPHSWFYGRLLTESEISAAARNLDDRGYVKAVEPFGRGQIYRASLTSRGMSCVEDFDGDPDQMEAPQFATGNCVTIGQFTQNGGSSAVNSTVGLQESSVVCPATSTIEARHVTPAAAAEASQVADPGASGNVTWTALDARVDGVVAELRRAVTLDDLQDVGRRCREILIDVGKLISDPALLARGQEAPQAGNAKAWLELAGPRRVCCLPPVLAAAATRNCAPSSPLPGTWRRR